MKSEHAANAALQHPYTWKHGRYAYAPTPIRRKTPLIRDKQDRIVVRTCIACLIVLPFII